AMAAMAVSVTAIFFNSLWGRPRLFFDAVLSVGRPVGTAPPRAETLLARVKSTARSTQGGSV
ncbi:MAG: hypothetical protein ACRELS_18755, partial [Candidatus Rokuibacteriota bacterium]